MSTTKGILDKIRAALGDANKDLAGELATALDELRAEADESASKLAESTKAAKAAEAKAAKLEKDLATKAGSESEALAKITAERDAAQRALEDATAAAGKVRLDYALRDAAREAGMRDLDGLKMLDTGGVTIDDAGKLTGAEKLFKAAKEAKPYLFGDTTTPQPGTGAAPKPGDAKGSGGKPEDEATALAKLIAQPNAAGARPGWGPIITNTTPGTPGVTSGMGQQAPAPGA